MRISFFLFVLSFLSIPSLFAQCPDINEYPDGKEAGNNVMFYFNQYYKEKNYKEAYNYWEKAFTGMSGESRNIYSKGVEINAELMEASEDPAEITKYEDNILAIYTKQRECFCEAENGRNNQCDLDEAYDRYYYVSRNQKEIFDIWTKAFSSDYKHVTHYYITPFIDLTVESISSDLITKEEAVKAKDLIYKQIDFQIAKGADELESYKEAKTYADQEFQTVATLMYDCGYFIEQARQQFEASKKDRNAHIDAQQYLVDNSCREHPYFSELQASVDRIDVQSRSDAAAKEASRLEAIRASESPVEQIKAIEASINDYSGNEQAKRYYKIATLYLQEIGSPVKAGSYARKAIKSDANWGSPHILLGLTYLKRYKSCGDSFEQQMAISAAIDKFYYAKKVDPSVATDANKYINQYSSNLPKKSAVFQRGLKVGDSYTVKCFGETTTIKTSN